MKKLLFLITVLLCAPVIVPAQKFAFVDTKYILSHIPDYLAAQQQINALSSQWQKDIEDKYASIEKLEKAYQAEKILLTDEMRKKREDEIAQKRVEAKDMQKQKFGVEGELFKKREELTKPIQDQIYEAIKEISSQNGLMVVFDKANHSNMLYTNPKHDISDKVIKKMGYKPGETLDDEKPEDDKGKQESKTTPGEGKQPTNPRDNRGGTDRPGGGKQ